jgi:hypothetical protein
MIVTRQFKKSFTSILNYYTYYSIIDVFATGFCFSIHYQFCRVSRLLKNNSYNKKYKKYNKYNKMPILSTKNVSSAYNNFIINYTQTIIFKTADKHLKKTNNLKNINYLITTLQKHQNYYTLPLNYYKIIIGQVLYNRFKIIIQL